MDTLFFVILQKRILIDIIVKIFGTVNAKGKRINHGNPWIFVNDDYFVEYNCYMARTARVATSVLPWAKWCVFPNLLEEHRVLKERPFNQ